MASVEGSLPSPKFQDCETTVPSESVEAAEENSTLSTGLPTAGVAEPAATGGTFGGPTITGTVAVVVKKSSSVTVSVALNVPAAV